MKKILAMMALVICAITTAWADTPILSILTTSQGEIQVPISTIQQITYDKTNGTEMYVTTASGTTTYTLSDVIKMTFSGVPAPTDIESISAEEATGAQKIFYKGAIYVIRDNKVYTIKGEKVQ